MNKIGTNKKLTRLIFSKKTKGDKYINKVLIFIKVMLHCGKTMVFFGMIEKNRQQCL